VLDESYRAMVICELEKRRREMAVEKYGTALSSISTTIGKIKDDAEKGYWLVDLFERHWLGRRRAFVEALKNALYNIGEQNPSYRQDLQKVMSSKWELMFAI